MISIIIVYRIISEEFNELWELTGECLNTLMKTADVDYELIVIDNGSHDDRYAKSLHVTAEIWNKMDFDFYKGFRQMRFEETVPLAQAWNEGVHQADGDWLMLANNDIKFFEAPWMSRMIEPFGWDDKQRVDNYLVSNILMEPIDSGKVAKKIVPIHSVGIVGVQHMSWGNFGGFVEGSLFVVPADFREEFNLSDDKERTKMFDEQFTLSCEDVDFNHRIQRAGYATIQVSHPPLQPRFLQHLGHRTVSTLAGTDEDYIKKSHENRVRLCEKWGFDPQIVD